MTSKKSVTIKFKVNKNLSFLRLIDSLSSWDKHTRKLLREWYIKKYGLDEEGKRLLEIYAAIRKKYGWKKLDGAFVENKSFKILEKTLTKKELTDIKLVFFHFHKNFAEIWGEFGPYLQKRKSALERISKKIGFEDVVAELKDRLCTMNFPKHILIHVILNCVENRCGGSANLDEHIFLEPLNVKKSSKELLLRDLSVCLHEIAHIAIRKSPLYRPILSLKLDKAEKEEIIEATTKAIAAFFENRLEKAKEDSIF
jgi:hypothetical protein